MSLYNILLGMVIVVEEDLVCDEVVVPLVDLILGGLVSQVLLDLTYLLGTT